MEAGLLDEAESTRVNKDISPPKRILVIDDETAIGRLISEALSREGFIVTTSAHGRQGIEMFMVEPFDIVITDLNLTDMDGFSLASLIKSASSRTIVGIITGAVVDQIASKLETSKVDFLLQKPFSLWDLRDAILRVLKER
jgi:DNA-binding response OmpR family regulator